MTAFYAPDPINSTQFIPGGNVPASGALLFCYQVGSSTKQNSYTDATASTARTNPIVLDSGGNVPGNGEVWIASTAKFVLAPSNDTDPPASPYWSRDNLPGVNDPSQVQSEWIPSGLSPTFVSGSSFIFSGDQTGTFTPGRRLKTLNTAGTFYSTIGTSAFSASTTIGIQSDTIGIDSGLSAVSYGILNPKNTSLPDIVHIYNFGPVGDGIADDNGSLQKLLNQGGKLVIGGGKIYRNASANLNLVSSTDLYIEQGTTLLLNSTRISAINVNDVHIYNSGIIKSTNLNTSDALPTGWQGRGIIEFGGTTTSPSQRISIEGPGEVMGDFLGVPGTGPVVTVNDRRRGIFFNNVSSAVAKFNNVHGINAEAIAYNGPAFPTNDSDIDIFENRIHDCNHDAISPFAFAPDTFRTRGNIMWNCLNGIEANIGEHQDNYAFNMVGAGYGLGGSNVSSSHVCIYRNNTGLNNGIATGSSDFSLTGAGQLGTLVCEGNTSIGAGAFGFVISFHNAAIIKENYATGWGASTVGSAFTWSNNNSSFVAGNVIFNEGAHSNGGYNWGGNTIWGLNTFSGVTTPYVGGNPNISTPGTISLTSDIPLVLTNQSNAAGASTATLTNSPHLGNPVFWPKISVNGSTLCFPAFQTS